MYESYVKRRPEDLMSDDSPFYLQPLLKWQDKSTWFSRQRVGKNKLGSFAKKASTKASLQGKHTNHGGGNV